MSEQLEMLKSGKEQWNRWRTSNLRDINLFASEGLDSNGEYIGNDLRDFGLTEVNLEGLDLRGMNLASYNFERANLRGADLRGTGLKNTNLKWADLRKVIIGRKNIGQDGYYEITRFDEADLRGSDFREAIINEVFYAPNSKLTGANLNKLKLINSYLFDSDLSGAKLIGTNLSYSHLNGCNLKMANLASSNLEFVEAIGANFSKCNLNHANLYGANLESSIMVDTDCTGAEFFYTKIYGIAAWNITLNNAIQKDLIITQKSEPKITVDNLEVAQFIYLLLNNEKIRDVIDTITSKAVLILGRFTDERKDVLEAIKDKLRELDYLPILFDFEGPASKDFTETIMTLASMSKFVIADLTDPKSIPHELSHIIPHNPSIVIRPIIHSSQIEYGMFEHFQSYPWVLPIHKYDSQQLLIDSIHESIIEPSEQKVKEIRSKKD